jgi:hypothetical protein
MKPEEIAVVHISGHPKGHNIESQGNRMADEAALQSEAPIFHLPLVILPLALPQSFVFKRRSDYQN